MGLLSPEVMQRVGGLFDAIGHFSPEYRSFRMQEEEAKRRGLLQQQEMAMRKAQFDAQQADAARVRAQEETDRGLLSRGLLGQMEAPKPDGLMGPMPAEPVQGYDPQWFLSQGGSVGGLGTALKINEAMKPAKGESPFAKINPADYTPESVAEFVKTGNIGSLVPYRKPEAPNTPSSVQEYQFATQQGYKGSYEQWVKEKAKAGAASTSLNVSTGPKAFWQDFGKGEADAFQKSREVASSAANTVRSIQQIRQAAQGGAYQGTGAEVKLGVAKALGALGMPYDSKTVANTELFNAQAKSFVLDTIKSLGANPSNADREFIEKTVPSLGTDPSALPRLLDFMEQKSRSQIRSYNSRAKQIQAQPEAQFLPYSLEIPEPEASGGWNIRPVR